MKLLLKELIINLRAYNQKLSDKDAEHIIKNWQRRYSNKTIRDAIMKHGVLK